MTSKRSAPGGSSAAGSTGSSPTSADLLVFLVETTWELSERYEPMCFEFSQWARPTLDKRITYWLRKEFFDGRYRDEPPELVPLDADDPELDRLGPALTGGSLDDGEHRLAAELRSLEARSRRPGGRNDRLG